MEYIIILLSAIISGAFCGGGNNHAHVHHHAPVGDCFGTQCDNHHPNCKVTSNNVGTCVDEAHCTDLCTDQHSTIPCCCRDQPCVDALRGGKNVLSTAPVSCPNCHSLRDCDMHHHQCHHDQVCLIQGHGHDAKLKCANQHECDHAKSEAQKHPDQFAICCNDDNCTQTQIQHLTTGVTQTLHCTTCHDLLTNQCDGDHTCKHDEVCMINHVDNRVETGCQKKPECDHQLQHNLHDPKAMTICCETLNCSHSAMKQAQHINVGVVSTAVIPASSAAPVVTSALVSNSPTTSTSGVCTDIEDAVFKCANYIRDFDICNQNTGTGAVLASTRCKMSCGLCQVVSTLSPQCDDDPTFQCATYIRDFDICNQINGTGFTLATTKCQKSCGLCPGSPMSQSQTSTIITNSQVQTTTQAPTVKLVAVAGAATQAPPAVSTTGSPTAASSSPPCIDHDLKNSCTAYSFYFCGATSGAARDFAISNCAKSCNLCNEYFASLKNSQGAPVVG